MELRTPSVNTLQITGAIVTEPVLRYMPGGGSCLCEFRMVCTDRYKNKKTGEMVEEKTFLDVQCWNKMAEWIAEGVNPKSGKKDFRVGMPVWVDGKIVMQEWNDKTTNQKRSKLLVKANRVQPLAWNTDGGKPGNTEQAAPSAATKPKQNEPEPEEGMDDGIPF